MTDSQLKKQGSNIISVSGRLSFTSVNSLLKDSKPFFNRLDDLTFDLSSVEASDSAGLALLVEWMSMANKSSQRISFQGVPKQMIDIAKVSGLDQVLSLVKPK